MPAFVKTERDERLWSKAKAIVREQYPWLKGDKFWARVNGIYQRMKSGN